jgi:hypothetical protein
VLARLDEIPGVRRSRAECSGHYILIELVEGFSDGVTPVALKVLGREAQVLTADEADVQHEARRRGEPWLTSQEARALSFVEGRMLGVRVSNAVSKEVGLTPEQQRSIADAVREEMFAHVERIHAGLAEAGRFFEAWPEIAARAADRCADSLGRTRVPAVARALVEYFRDSAAR